MDINELRSKPHLSASGINDYVECGLLFKFGRILKLKPEFRPDALEFGSAIHKVLAEFYRHRMEGVDLPVNHLLALFEALWRDAAEDRTDILYKEGKDFETLLGEGKELISAYYRKLPRDDFSVIAIEEPFSFNLPGLPVPMIGVFDLIEEDESGTIIVTDWKTSSHAFSKDEVDKNFQITLYHMAVRSNGYGDKELLLRFDCLIKTRQPRFEQYYTTRSKNDERRVERKILSVWEAISKGVFVPNDGSWKCKGCVYRTHCDRWFNEEG